jgi:translation initiation factor IF-3
VREVRLIAADGAQLGIKPLPEALQLAREAELDLVEIAPMANPPVCKILDYSKWVYEQRQRDKESRKKSQAVVIKEMKYRPKIGGGDFDTKTRKVGEFLEEGHKVKVTIMFRGREVAHPELGMKILNKIAETIGVAAKMEAIPKLDGRNMVMVLAPDKKAQVAAAKAAKAEGRTVVLASMPDADRVQVPIAGAEPVAVTAPAPAATPAADSPVSE